MTHVNPNYTGALILADAGQAIEAQVFGPHRLRPFDPQAGTNISIAINALGAIISSTGGSATPDDASLVIAQQAYQKHPADIPTIRASDSSINVVLDALGYALSVPAGSTVDNANNIIATQEYGQHIQRLIREYDLLLSDNTLKDVSTAAHGFAPKAPNDSTKFLRGDATWAAPGSSSPFLIPWFGTQTLTAPPAVSGFTWVNQESATATEANSTVKLYTPNETGTHLHLLVKAKSPSYTITAKFIPNLNGNYLQGGLCWRDSAGGKIITWGPNFDIQFGLRVCKWNSATAVSAYYTSGQYAAPGNAGQASTAISTYPIWLKIEDNNTNRICYYSLNGVEWVAFHTIGRTDFITADQIGYYVGTQTTTTLTGSIELVSWVEA